MDEENKEEKVILEKKRWPFVYEYGILNESQERYYRKLITR